MKRTLCLFPAALCVFLLLLLIPAPAGAFITGIVNASQGPPGSAFRITGYYSDGFSPTEYVFIFMTNATFGGSLRFDGVRPDNFNNASITGVNATFVQAWILNTGNYNYTWNTGAITGGSLLPGSAYSLFMVNQSLNFTVARNTTNTYTKVAVAIEGPITPGLTATPLAGYAPLTVEFADSSTGYPSSWTLDYGDGTPPYTTSSWLTNPAHTYPLPGTYNVTLTATNSYGPRSTTESVRVVSRYGSGGSGGHNSKASSAALQQQQPQQPAPAPLPGPVGMASQTYVIGTDGVAFTKDPATGTMALSIDSAAAAAGGAVVIFNEKQVTVYHRHSPGVLLTFSGDFTNVNGTISGTVSHAGFLTDPMTGNMTYGHVDASVGAEMFSLPENAKVNVTIRENASSGLSEKFAGIAGDNGMEYSAMAYSYEVDRIDFATTGAANVTMTVPAAWVDTHGGKDDIRIFRFSPDTGVSEAVRTTFTGTDPKGNMVFKGDSPKGTSIFGLVAAKATAQKQAEEPEATIIPSSKPAITTDIGMIGWLYAMVSENPAIIIVVLAAACLAGYLGYRQRHRRLP